MSYLHPGTVIGPDFESDYVLVQLDDGDSRDVHIDQVRFLPENYPHVGELLREVIWSGKYLSRHFHISLSN